MSIARPCPFSVESEFCKYETQIGTPNLKMCDKCNWNPKKEQAHSVNSYKEGNMEVEMKARITDEQIDKLLQTDLSSFGFKIKEQPKFLSKDDVYYSKNGENILNPTTVIRTRTEGLIIADSIKKIFDKISACLLSEKKNFITVKHKATDSDGVETNEETEGEISEEAVTAFNLAMVATGYMPYFTKSKQSASFYVEVLDGSCKGKEIHCEIVTVNGRGPYLEIEAFVTHDETQLNFESVIDAQRTIKNFFKKVLGITEFDGRSWHKIILEEED